MYINPMVGYRRWAVKENGPFGFSSLHHFCDQDWEPHKEMNANCKMNLIPFGPYGIHKEYYEERVKKHKEEGVPVYWCSCGFYSHSEISDHNLYKPKEKYSYFTTNTNWSVRYSTDEFFGEEITVYVPGITENWGKTVLHDNGFRSEKQKMVAIFPESNGVTAENFAKIIESWSKINKKGEWVTSLYSRDTVADLPNPHRVYIAYLDLVEKIEEYAQEHGLPVIDLKDVDDFVESRGYLRREDLG